MYTGLQGLRKVCQVSVSGVWVLVCLGTVIRGYITSTQKKESNAAH